MGVARTVHRGADAGGYDGGVWAADDAALAPASDADDREGREVAARDAAGDVDARRLIVSVLREVSEHVFVVKAEALYFRPLPRRKNGRRAGRHPYGVVMPNSNYWVEFEGRRVQATYLDGKELLRLQTDVVEGKEKPQFFNFFAAGVADGPEVAVFVGDPDRPLTVTNVETYRPDQG